ncbi:MAG: hypothetical protein WD275_08580 [Rhodothermales bacterium]
MIQSAIFTLGILLLASPTTDCEVDLSKTDRLTVVNRAVSPLEDGTGARLDARPGDGVAWVEGCSFSEGVIELDLRGKDVPGRSFVGVAFRGVDDSTYKAVYVRPFNFRAEDRVRHDHAVQYISHPEHTWFSLREAYPEVYKNPVEPAPDPNDWVHVRVVVSGSLVSVFVGDGEEPDLVVERLSGRESGMVGLWVGNGSDGDFANLVIRPAL